MGLSDPSVPKLIQPGGGYTAVSDLGLARQTADLIRYGSPTKKSVMWPDPSTAPSLDLTAIDTNQFFFFAGLPNDFGFPWYTNKQADRIRIRLYIGLRGNIRTRDTNLEVRISKQKLVTTTITENTAFRRVQASQPMPSGPWLQDDGNFHMATADFQLQDLTIPADRRILLKIQGKFTTPGTNDPFHFTVNREAKIYAVKIADILLQESATAGSTQGFRASGQSMIPRGPSGS